MGPDADADRSARPLRRPPIPGILARLLERAYCAELDRRNRRFDAGLGVIRLDLPVISVGNLSVGGTGKTPMVREIVRWLRDAGQHPAIALRGYKARNAVSDEAAEYARELPGTPIAVGADRAASIRALLRSSHPTPIDTIVLDDGFQHRRLARDLDIVLIDATRTPCQDRCLPAGWLREPVQALARANAVVITRADHATAAPWNDIARSLHGSHSHLLIAACTHEWEGLQVAPDTDAIRTEPVRWLAGRPIVIACAIGNPDAFIAQAMAHAGPPNSIFRRPDHHAWRSAEARAIEAALARAGRHAILLTTVKDWVKLAPLASPALRDRSAVPSLRLRFIEGAGELQRLVLATRTSAPANHPTSTGARPTE